MNVSLPDQLKAFAEARADGGPYSNVSDYVRDLIRRDQMRQSAVAEVQALIEDGLASGPTLPFAMDDFLAGKKA